MALSIGCDLELCFCLGTANLARRALLARFVLSLLRCRQHLARGYDRSIVLRNLRFDLTSSAAERLEARDEAAFALDEPLDERPRLRGFTCCPLVLSRNGRRMVGGFRVRPRGLGC